MDSSGAIPPLENGHSPGGMAVQSVENEQNRTGLRMADLVTLPDLVRETINWMLRKREVRLADMVDRMQQDEATARATLADLVERGYLWETRVEGETLYRVRLAPQPRRPSRILDI